MRVCRQEDSYKTAQVTPSFHVEITESVPTLALVMNSTRISTRWQLLLALHVTNKHYTNHTTQITALKKAGMNATTIIGYKNQQSLADYNEVNDENHMCLSKVLRSEKFQYSYHKIWKLCQIQLLSCHPSVIILSLWMHYPLSAVMVHHCQKTCKNVHHTQTLTNLLPSHTQTQTLINYLLPFHMSFLRAFNPLTFNNVTLDNNLQVMKYKGEFCN